MKKKFKARTGAPFHKKDAQKIGEELSKIKVLNPEKVIDKAKDPKSILNKYFEWDNTKAGEKFRLQQARNIVNHVIEIIVIKENPIEARAFFNVVAKSGENEYVSLTEAVTTPSYKKQLLREMETILENLLRLIKLFSSME